MSVSDGRLHATTSVYSTWIILANTAYQARVSGITGFRMDSFTPGGHSLPTDFTVNCLWIHFNSLVPRLSLSFSHFFARANFIREKSKERESLGHGYEANIS